MIRAKIKRIVFRVPSPLSGRDIMADFYKARKTTNYTALSRFISGKHSCTCLLSSYFARALGFVEAFSGAKLVGVIRVKFASVLNNKFLPALLTNKAMLHAPFMRGQPQFLTLMVALARAKLALMLPSSVWVKSISKWLTASKAGSFVNHMNILPHEVNFVKHWHDHLV